MPFKGKSTAIKITYFLLCCVLFNIQWPIIFSHVSSLCITLNWMTMRLIGNDCIAWCPQKLLCIRLTSVFLFTPPLNCFRNKNMVNPNSHNIAFIWNPRLPIEGVCLYKRMDWDIFRDTLSRISNVPQNTSMGPQWK